MSPVERVRSVIEGIRPDRPPVSFWHHFPPDQVSGAPAVKAHLDHLNRYGLDFLKVMNDNGYPHDGVVGSVKELASVVPLRGDEPPFQKQLDLLADLRRQIQGRVMMTTTIFNAWAVLRHLIQPPTRHKPPNLDASVDQPSQAIRRWIAEDYHAVEAAIGNISVSLENFARKCIEAGADGVYLSVRDDWVEAEGVGLYARLVRPADLRILEGAANGRFNMLHVCGRPMDFRAFGEYPVQVMNWADRAAGPGIAEVKDWLRPAICGGVDNLSTLPRGTPEDVQREVADTIQQAGNRPIMISPGCTYDPDVVPKENLEAMVKAVS